MTIMEITNSKSRTIHHPDAITRPIVVKFWNSMTGVWVRLTIKYNARAYAHPFVLLYEGYRTVPFKTKPYLIQPPARYNTLDEALNAMKSYVRNWATME